MSKTVLFDLDGTLLDTERDFTQILNSQLSSHGLPPVNALKVRNSVSSGARALIKLGYKIDESNQQFDALLDEFLERYDDCIPQTECVLFPGIPALIKALDKAAIPWGIVTNKPSRFTLPLLKNFPVLDSSGVVICADHLQNSKPDPEGILMACDRMQSIPGETIYVGDHLKDVQASKAAGTISIAVRWGYIPDDLPIENWQADHVINHPDEILDQATR